MPGFLLSSPGGVGLTVQSVASLGPSKIGWNSREICCGGLEEVLNAIYAMWLDRITQPGVKEALFTPLADPDFPLLVCGLHPITSKHKVGIKGS